MKVRHVLQLTVMVGRKSRVAVGSICWADEACCVTRPNRASYKPDLPYESANATLL